MYLVSKGYIIGFCTSPLWKLHYCYMNRLTHGSGMSWFCLERTSYQWRWRTTWHWSLGCDCILSNSDLLITLHNSNLIALPSVVVPKSTMGHTCSRYLLAISLNFSNCITCLKAEAHRGIEEKIQCSMVLIEQRYNQVVYVANVCVQSCFGEPPSEVNCNCAVQGLGWQIPSCGLQNCFILRKFK